MRDSDADASRAGGADPGAEESEAEGRGFERFGPAGRPPRRPWVDRSPRPMGTRAQQPWRRPEPFGAPTRPGAPAPPLEEGEELVAGRRPVEEAFAAGRPAHRLLVTPQRRQALEKIVLHATTLRIPIVEVEGGSLTALAGFDGHQGVAVVVEARRFASVDDLLARSIERGEPAFVLVLDSLEDPQNVGTLLRSAEAVGVHGVVFPTERQAPLSPAAVKASAGATEHLLLAPVDDLPATLTDLHLRGIRIVGSDGDAALAAREADLRGPIALVVGSEGHGLSPAVRRRCDLFVRLPMRGAIESLNAAVAGSVLLFEMLGQRDGASAAPESSAGPANARASKAPRRKGSTAAKPVAEAPDALDGATPPEAARDTAAASTPGDSQEAASDETASVANAKPARKPRSGAKKAAASGVAEPAVAAEPADHADEDAPPPPKKRTRASFGKAPASKEVPAGDAGAGYDGADLLPD
jgi:23S rRNA (guanosine2251-2'-O)-methyltransferase